MKNEQKHGKFKVDFIGVGAPRCATTWISECLAQHPEICFSKIKEIGFFNETFEFLSDVGIKKKNLNYGKGLEWYKQYFNHCKRKKIIGEFSTNYLQDQKAPNRIKKFFPNVKIIIIIRNPIVRLYSFYYNILRRYCINLSFEEFVNKYKNYVKNKSHFYPYIKRYFSIFKKENIKIILQEDIEENPLKVIKDLYSFLNVDNSFIPSASSRYINKTHIPRNEKIYNFLIWFKMFWKKRIKGLTPIHKIMLFLRINKIFDYVLNKYILTPQTNTKINVEDEISKNTIKYLVNLYSLLNRKLEELIKINLRKKWGF